jgi:hypothetical protein
MAMNLYLDTGKNITGLGKNDNLLSQNVNRIIIYV